MWPPSRLESVLPSGGDGIIGMGWDGNAEWALQSAQTEHPTKETATSSEL